MERLNLSGSWQATQAVGLQATVHRTGDAEGQWFEIPVPGHWQDCAPYARHQGKLLYRRTFDLPGPLPPEAVARLVLAGVFYHAKVWLNGRFLGEDEGYFHPHIHAATRALVPGENVLLVEVDSPDEKNLLAKRQITGIWGHWDCREPGFNPGGLWREVWLEIYRHGLVPDHLAVTARPERLPLPPGAAPRPAYVPEGEPIPATVQVGLEYTATVPGELAWELTVLPETFTGDPVTVAGRRHCRPSAGVLTAAVRLPDARLWWSWDHGRPDLYRVRLTLHPPGGGEPLVLERVTGIRTVSMRRWHLYLNGRRVYLRGSNYPPPDIRIARCQAADYQRDLELARQANLNALRVHAHIDRPELYEAADRAGILLWQDFPLQWFYHRSIYGPARRQAAAMARLLGHHPSVAIWCAHNEPIRFVETDAPGRLPLLGAVLSMFLPNWNRNVLDRALARTLRQVDGSRPVVPYSGGWGVFWGGTDTHHYWGWYVGSVEWLERVAGLRPGLSRMVTEYGSQSFPVLASSRRFVTGRWPDLNWEELDRRYMLQPAIMERYVPRAAYDSLEAYIAATQTYQNLLLKRYTELWRLYKYRPGGGAFHFMFSDCSPGVSWSVLDYWREPKPAYHLYRQVFRPVQILAPWPRRPWRPGRLVVQPVYVVNDRYRSYRGRWHWRLERAGSRLAEGSGEVEVPPDGLVQAGGVHWMVPPDLPPGPVELVLRLELPEEEPAENRYEAWVGER